MKAKKGLSLDYCRALRGNQVHTFYGTQPKSYDSQAIVDWSLNLRHPPDQSDAKTKNQT